jgi:phosphoribosylformylglycinamidine cyclo-ligase
VADVVEGVAAGCREAGCALLGGETAELPDMYGADDLDLAGFALGIVERDAVIDGSEVAAGDAVIGLAASGVHANGFTLVRRLLERAGLGPGAAPGDLLAPTRIYARAAEGLRAACRIRAMAHITGGGVPGNLPRVLPAGLGACVDERRWPAPAVFGWLAGLGVERAEMRHVFNGGIGFAAVVPAAEAEAAVAACEAAGCEAWRIGDVVPGEGVAYLQEH